MATDTTISSLSYLSDSNLTVVADQSDPPSAGQQYSAIVHIFSMIVGIPAICFGSAGNLLTIIAVVKTPQLRNPSNLFVISLAVSDFLSSCITVPTLITVYANSAWVLGKINGRYCQFFSIFILSNMGAAVLSLSWTAFGRYLKIVHPSYFSKFLGSKWKARLVTLSCWVVPIFFLLPGILEVWGELGYDSVTMVCTYVRTPANKSYNMFIITSSVLIPFTSIMFCYLQILCKIHSNHRRVALMRQNEQLTGANQLHRRPSTLHREDVRYTAMMASIFFVFFCSYCPYYINLLVDPEGENISTDAGTAMCQWLSSFLHPVIYVLMNQHFRKAFTVILHLPRGKDNEAKPSNQAGSMSNTEYINNKK